MRKTSLEDYPETRTHVICVRAEHDSLCRRPSTCPSKLRLSLAVRLSGPYTEKPDRLSANEITGSVGNQTGKK